MQFDTLRPVYIDPGSHDRPYKVPKTSIGHIFLIHELCGLSEQLLDPCVVLCTCLYVENSPNLFHVVLDGLSVHFSLVLQVCLCTHQEEHHFLVPMFSDLLEP